MTVVASLHSVTVTFGAREVLKECSFEFQAGRRYVLEGRSGSGKSSVLNLLAKYLFPNRGGVVTARSVSYLLQEDTLFNGVTALDHAQIAALGPDGLEPSDIEPVGALEIVGLSHALQLDVARLSGGERQRVRLAMALVRRTDLLLLDEPTSALDDETRDEFLETLVSAFPRATIVIASHDRSLVGLVPDARLLRLSGGAIHEV